MDDVKALTERIEAARQLVADISSGKRPWRVCIPPQPDDPDVLLAKLLEDVAAALAAPRPLGEPAPGSPLPLEHWRTCSAGWDDADCTCGLEWRIRLATEQEMHNAWRKRAEEAEAREIVRPSGEREAPADLVALHRRLYDAAIREKRTQAEMVIRPDIEEKALAHDEAEMDRIAAYLDLLAWRPSPPGERPAIEVGDWYVALGCDPTAVDDKRWVEIANDYAAKGELDELRGERNGVAFVWRRS